MKRWTRDRITRLPWNPFQTVENLVLVPGIREKLERITGNFLQGQEAFHSRRLMWREGIFFFGPAGSGKSAAGRAVARALGWEHLTVPAHEILDSHLLELALADGASSARHVIVLEDIDEMIRRMDPKVFFTVLDHAMESADETFWVATSRHPDLVPKSQLIRPGRFEEALRLEPPSPAIRSELLRALAGDAELGNPDGSVIDLVEQTEGLSFSHFEEMRQIGARMKLEQRETETWASISSYIQDQVLSADRSGGISDETENLSQRVQNVDPRMLMAALDMTSVFRRVVEKVTGDLVEKARDETSEGE